MAKTRAKPRELGRDLQAWAGRSAGMAQAHHHADLELNFVLAGMAQYLIQGRLIRLPQRRLCLLWGATPHQMFEPQSLEMIWVTAPMDMLWRMRLSRSFMSRLMRRGVMVDASPCERDEAQLRQWCDDLATADPRRETIVQLELEARLRRIALAASERGGARGARLRRADSDGAAKHVRAMARHVADHLTQPLAVDDIAAAAGIGANHAMTLFRRHTGMTLSTYVTRQRIARAQRLLTQTRRPVLQVGFDCGFGSVSRFYEAFGREAGASPAAYRRNHRRLAAAGGR